MEKFTKFVCGLILGAVGASMYVALYTPKNGEAVRDGLKQAVQNIKKTYDDAAAEKRRELEEQARVLRQG